MINEYSSGEDECDLFSKIFLHQRVTAVFAQDDKCTDSIALSIGAAVKKKKKEKDDRKMNFIFATNCGGVYTSKVQPTID